MMSMNALLDPAVARRAKGLWPVVAVAFFCWISIVLCLDPGGSYPGLPEGPGLTIDESFNVEQGYYLVEQARALGWLNLMPGTSQEAYRVENGYNPDHPPLGRWWLGIHHHLMWRMWPPREPDGPVVTACARSGSATAFALTVLLVGATARGWSGTAAGVMTAMSVVMMPRLFGHAHLASLETITNLTCTAATLAVANWWAGPALPTRRIAMLTGILFGLALLTKIQAVLIPVPVACWALWRWRTHAILPLVWWGLAAFVVFFAGWPYLWTDPPGHLLEYLGRTTNRATIQVWYLGQKYADKAVPWHYSLVMFAVTVPAVLHGLGLLGLFHRVVQHPADLAPDRPRTGIPLTTTEPDRDSSRAIDVATRHSRDVLLLACALFPLAVFALPGVAVYDGERLFLTTFPLWALFIGRGWVALWHLRHGRSHSRAIGAVACSACLLFAASPLVTMTPCHLSYYNRLVPLIAGKGQRHGLEIDYWGEGITRQLLQRLVEVVPAGSEVAVVPTLHQFQADEYRRQSPILRRHKIATVEYRDRPPSQKYVLVFRRRADLPERLIEGPVGSTILAATRLHGETLAYLAEIAE
jgi:hypothetical protein